MIDRPRILALVGEMDGCSLWRCLLPITELQRQGYEGAQWGMKDDDRLALIAHKFHAIILPRLHWPPEEKEHAARWFAALRRAGLTMIYELDDDLVSDDFIQRLIHQHGYGEQYASDRRASILTTIRECDGITVSSQRLATLIRHYISDIPIAVIPNSIDLRWFKLIQKQAQRKVTGLTIGWAGGNRPDADIADMAQAWARIAKRYSDITFVVQGHHAPAIYDTVPNERIAALDWLPIDYYPAGLVNIDIGCCPLGDTPFNRCKTPIKAMEYAASNAAVVASPTVYNQIIEYGITGYIAHDVDEWEAALSKLIESYDLRKKITKALLAKVKREHSLERNAWRWLAAWADLINDARSRQRMRPKILLPKGVSYASTTT